MAYAHWKAGRHLMRAAFSLHFRSNPFHGGYTVLAGLEDAVRFLNNFKFEQQELDFLQGMKSPRNKPMFDAEFLKFLEKSRFECDVEALPEGEIVFPHEPLVKVCGPIWQA